MRCVAVWCVVHRVTRLRGCCLTWRITAPTASTRPSLGITRTRACAGVLMRIRRGELSRGSWDFGKAITQRFLRQNHLSLMIRSATLDNNGYYWCHDNRVLTVYSAAVRL